MGYMIFAEDNQKHKIAELDVPMGTFRMLKQQLYDWFGLLNARDCDGDMSGRGIAKKIKRDDIENAKHVLEKHDPRGRLARLPMDISIQMELNSASMTNFLGPGLTLVSRGNVDEFEDTFNTYKHDLNEFMADCLQWCQNNGQQEIVIVFA